MQWPSLSLIFTQIFLAYIVYTIYSMSLLFVTPSCEDGKPCLKSYLNQKPRLQLQIYSSVEKYPADRQQLDFIYSARDFNYTHSNSFPVSLNVPRKTRNNGTLFLHFFIEPSSNKHRESIMDVEKDPYISYTAIEMTQYVIPKAEAINLLGEKDSNAKKKKETFLHPVTHIKSRITFTIMTDDIKLPVHNVPAELIHHLKIVQGRTFLPIVKNDFLQTRHSDLVRLMPHNNTVNMTLQYSPISLGKLRMLLHVEGSMQTMKYLGFSDKDVDEVKGIFADTNIYLLGGTFFIATIHLLFDFLAFKNDVSYWRRKDNLVGLSRWTVVWRGISQTVVFLYLLEEGSSLLVLMPAGIGSIIEIWKLKKVLKLRLNKSHNSVAEMKTREFDMESMRYLSYLLYPLVIGGAIYSLLYQPHKSWYSWSINSLVNGVYAFGFLFMLPQLFVNYKLKSVAHLPWRTFMYKAFNTFIDDVFAFVIVTPTAHRIACFRDDTIFLIYLYQRWLYPVDKSRPDGDTIGEESVDYGSSSKKTN
ncbi:PREDICTED: cleft lip and palate transmembrane protein 1-like protein [Dufourea novaeangliae]|uniref:Lipid scramblase CLPTM1L n=1 Tax=Dufourea novaeangliae TaxID=178035 RepID=A0A154P527_DUFNO|nr:PREDICTED: cleft lip and palate transmembrane protein 1-like protein [Dufourea novaeangliae]KZC06952.1 Cleft lip and palate transmembrane protein 1-like protein [Dufourea novaeangliae]